MDVEDFITAGIDQAFLTNIAAMTFRRHEITSAADGFRANMRRITDLQALPGWLCASMRRMGDAHGDAVEEVTGQRKLMGDQLLDKGLNAKIDAVYFRNHKAREAEPDVGIASKAFSGMVSLMHTEFMYDSGPLSLGFEAICQSMVVNGWTAFEVLSQDIYEGAHGSLPNRFQGLRTFRMEYERLLQPNHADFITVFGSDSMKALALVRNLLVHKAGVIDPEFLASSAAVPSLQAFRTIGEVPLPLTGTIVKGLIDGMSTQACALLTAANRWI